MLRVRQKSSEGISSTPSTTLKTKKIPTPTMMVFHSRITASQIPDVIPLIAFNIIKGKDKAATTPCRNFITVLAGETFIPNYLTYSPII
jgi:hypothetical protein